MGIKDVEFMESQKTMRVKRTRPQDSILKSGLMTAVYFVCGIVVSKGAVLGSLAPFGASYAAAVPKKHLVSALLGTAFGYILLTPSDGFRYIAVIAAIGGIRWLMSDLKKISSSKIFAPLVAFLPILATGVALLFVSTSTLSSFADCVIEAVLAGAAAYFINVSVSLADDRRGLGSFTQQETASLVMTGCILVLAFGSLTVYNISLGKIIAVIIVMLCARYGAITGGAVSGIATGAVFSIAGRQQNFICGCYAFGGLMSGLFKPLGKFGCAIAFVIANGVMCLVFGSSFSVMNVFTESLIGATVFMILPKELESFISPLFSTESTISLADTLRKNIVMRLEYAAKAVYNVRNDVNKVSDKLQKLYSPSFESVCEHTKNEVCANCGLKTYCYEHKGGVTYDDFHRLEELLETQGKIDEFDIENVFVKNCCKRGEIAQSMNANYREYLSSLDAQRRASDIRATVAGQFSGVSDILSDLSKEFENTMKCDSESAQRIMSALNAAGIIPIECVCLIGENGRMTVELELSSKSENKISRSALMREVSRQCGRRFDLPAVTSEGDRIRAAFCEMPVFDVEIGSAQHIADDGKLCGDCIDYFNDGTGKLYAIVCDGMGTGGRAAVDGNMAVSVMSRLLKSGLSADSALQITNSALMVKSEDESLSTVDITSIDLYTGRVTVKKAGAPLTFVKKSGRVVTKEMPSLPAGILNGIKFSTDTFGLTTGDMIVMVSDGAVTGDDKWLEKLIRSWSEGSVQDLAQAVVEEAAKRRNGEYEDDITALAMRITDNGE